MNTFKKLLITVAIACCLVSCNRSEAGKQSDQSGKPAIAVETVTAVLSDLTDCVEVTGSLEPKFSVDVKTQIPGLVKQVFVTEWVRVRKGQPLARIDVAETEALVKRAEAGVESARASQAQAQVSLNRAEREMERSIKLKQAGLATQQSVDDAGSEQDAARARLVASRAQLAAAGEELRQARTRLTKGLITAPMDGVVALREVNVGDLTSDAAAAKPIFRIVDNRLLNLTVTVSSTDSARIRVGQPLEFSVDSLPGRTFSGKVMYINPELSSVDRSLKVIAEVVNTPELLKGGLFAKGRIVTGSKSAVLQVPRSAIDALDLTTRRGALFIIEKGLAHRSAVVTGAANGERIEIVSGLKAGQQLVVRGGFNLKDGDRVVAAAAK
ncbi:MAG: efflux RND transporter periplasmic adaptor subunit [Desulfuromonadales bacterium]|nr:efflux RND transporter periplasmic adaptor subunit [Desulfuromonadales bacterium]